MWRRHYLLVLAVIVGLGVGGAGKLLDPLVGVHCHNPFLSSVTGVVLLASAVILNVPDNPWACRFSLGLAIMGGAHILHTYSGNAISIVAGFAVAAGSSWLNVCQSRRGASS